MITQDVADNEENLDMPQLQLEAPMDREMLDADVARNDESVQNPNGLAHAPIMSK